MSIFFLDRIIVDFIRLNYMATFDILLIFNLVVILYVWFDTNAIIEWVSLLKLRFFKYKEYEEHKKSPVPMFAVHSYPDFLAYKYGPKSFLIRMITCSICFSVWCNIVLLCIFFDKLEFLWIGPNIIMSWLGYHSLRWMLKVFNA